MKKYVPFLAFNGKPNFNISQECSDDLGIQVDPEQFHTLEDQGLEKIVEKFVPLNLVEPAEETFKRFARWTQENIERQKECDYENGELHPDAQEVWTQQWDECAPLSTEDATKLAEFKKNALESRLREIVKESVKNKWLEEDRKLEQFYLENIYKAPPEPVQTWEEIALAHGWTPPIEKLEKSA